MERGGKDRYPRAAAACLAVRGDGQGRHARASNGPGELVAYLVPAESGGTVLERMGAAGQVRPAIGQPPRQDAASADSARREDAHETLLEMRDEERY